MTNKLYQDKKWLTQKYLSENKTQQEIAQICEAGKSTIGTWCRKFGLTKQNPHLNSRNKLSSNKPKLMEEWSENNTLDPDQLTTHSSKKALWVCTTCEEEWEAEVERRSQGHGCPYCAGQKVYDDNRLSKLYPHLVKEWSPQNNKQPDQYTYGSDQIVWWCCADCGYEYEQKIALRSAGYGCPACAGKVPTSDNNLKAVYPKLAKQWSSKNKKDPTEFCCKSKQKAWWVCDSCKKEWEASIQSRTLSGSGCPYCSGHRVSDKNRLTTHYPEIAKQWSTKNMQEAASFSHGSNCKVWWFCFSCEEHWKAAINNRTKGQGCPRCNLPGNGWELSYKKYLDDADIQYEYHPEHLETPLGRYHPDFWIEQEGRYIEIKAQYWERDLQNQKIEWLRNQGHLIHKLHGKDLKERGILK